MRTPDNEFRLLLTQVKDGSHEATRELIERYGPHIFRAVRRKLNKAIRAKFDSVDFVQVVWASFFAVPQKLVEFDRPEELIGYLAAMAHNKVVDEIRRRMETDKYNVNREQSLDDSARGLGARLTTRQPSPSEVAVADELWERLLQGKPDRHRRIIELRRNGYTYQQIAYQLGLNERTVRRVIRLVLEERVS